MANNPPTPPAGEQATPSAVQTKLAKFMLGVMGDSVSIDREKGNAVDIQITTLAFDSNHKSVGTSSEVLATSFKPEMLQKILQTGIGIPEKVELTPAHTKSNSPSATI
jgi:hypothetical protein